MKMIGKECSFCKHVYVFPCDGKRYDCANAVFIRANGGKPAKAKAANPEPEQSKRKRVRLTN